MRSRAGRRCSLDSVTSLVSSGTDLSGKTVAVTGASSGLGLTTAQALAAKGARVILGARSTERGEHALARLTEATGNRDAHLVVADLSSGAGAQQMVAAIRERFDRLDVLINNAGVDVGQRQVTADGLELTFAVNYMAPFAITNGLLELLEASAPALDRVTGRYLKRRRELSTDPPTQDEALARKLWETTESLVATTRQ